MSEVRKPWWGHNATQEQLDLGRKFQPCRDGCGAYIILVKAPGGGSWIPMQQVGERPNESSPGQFERVMAIHHDLCNNARVPGIREPTRSHRITVNEDKPAVDEEQVRFNLRPPTPTEG